MRVITMSRPNPNNKVPDYIEYRVAGLAPLEAAVAAGYAQSGIRVTASRLEQREDVRLALRVAKRNAKPGDKKLHPLTSPVSKRHHRSVADEPRHGDGPNKSPLDPWRLKDRYSSPLDLMLDVMNNPEAPGGLRIQCAKDAMPYCHARKEGGKKDDEKSKAKQTASESKFGSQKRPSHLALAA